MRQGSGLRPTVIFILGSFSVSGHSSNFPLANWYLPAIIWCFADRTRLASVQQIAFLCQQCDIAPSSSPLHSFSSRAIVRRNARELFLLVWFLRARQR